MRNPGGYSIITNPGERAVEHDLSNCAHCHAVMFMNAGFGQPKVMIYRADGTFYLKDVDHCRNCWGYVCPKAQCQSECKNYFRKLDEEEKQARFICS